MIISNLRQIKAWVKNSQLSLVIIYADIFNLLFSVNLYTELDAYTLPLINDMVNILALYQVFSTFDLKSAYHRVPIKDDDRKYTGFEVNGRL